MGTAIQDIQGITGESNEFDNAVRLAKEQLEAAQREVEIAKREVEEFKTQVFVNCDRQNELSRKIGDQWGVYMQRGGGVWRAERIPEDRLRLIREEIEKKKSIKEKKETIESHGGYKHCSCGLIGEVEKEEKELEEKEKELRELGAAIKEYEGIKGEHEKSIEELKLAEERLKAAMANVEEWNKKSEKTLKKQKEERGRIKKIKEEEEAKKRAEASEKKESGMGLGEVAAAMVPIALNFIPGMAAVNTATKGVQVAKEVLDGG
ncbi:MAG: hypothetical protein LBF34_03220 [Puniceicoccales bacterium]|jgi:myosin heavy subunit|nr:hypothetical protein [Puniceicoccales bacterium]